MGKGSVMPIASMAPVRKGGTPSAAKDDEARTGASDIADKMLLLFVIKRWPLMRRPHTRQEREPHVPGFNPDNSHFDRGPRGVPADLHPTRWAHVTGSPGFLRKDR